MTCRKTYLVNCNPTEGPMGIQIMRNEETLKLTIVDKVSIVEKIQWCDNILRNSHRAGQTLRIQSHYQHPGEESVSQGSQEGGPETGCISCISLCGHHKYIYGKGLHFSCVIFSYIWCFKY